MPLMPVEYARQAYWLMFAKWARDDSTIKPPDGMTELGKALIAMGVNLDDFQVQILQGSKKEN